MKLYVCWDYAKWICSYTKNTWNKSEHILIICGMVGKSNILAQSQPKSQICSETMLTGEIRFHISTPLGFWTRVPHDSKQTGSPLYQWDMVRMKWDCRLSTGLPLSSRLWVVKLEGVPAASVKPGQKSCVIKLIKSAYTLSAQSLVKHLLKGNKASNQNHGGVTNVARQRFSFT
jgi:hypothetical protein